MTAKGVKDRITLLTLQHRHYFDICDRLNREGFGELTKVLISHHRDIVMQVVRVMMDEGLISQKTLDRYRADAKEEQKARFKRRADALPR